MSTVNTYNVVMHGFGFMLLFTAFQTSGGFQATVLKDVLHDVRSLAPAVTSPPTRLAPRLSPRQLAHPANRRPSARPFGWEIH